ncbi:MULTISPECIES: arsinothricin resistance N-acetyltransferase ArsN1 family A [Paenibacillus]|uniref:arsinothricin resistance N-acetyltransferase ArsN1 family A n=1 Tax=Paenibacillus TaxID=44249 RepID=UPI00129E9A7D|nr:MULTISPECIES: arsinothricin resistance N-acetyltransferase ArsN1 family A [Paenibacillus]MBE7681228.1 GNAT family N-acetyltransferase [Paenibacillus sp. P13VS]MBY0215912.1 N-acetyltransferase [Paenibacillus illinoisensis]
MNMVILRQAIESDLRSILTIYNQGIEDRIATLETELKDESYMYEWFKKHQGRYTVLVAEANKVVIGWASINAYNPRSAYDGVGDLSIYIHRDHRGKGIGQQLLQKLEDIGKQNNFYKFVLFTFPFNTLGQSLYHRAGYREVGVFQNQGLLEGNFVDVMAMEKLL